MTEAERQALLVQLRDAQAPLPPGWWPPAPGWWMLLALTAALALLMWWLAKKRRPHWQKSALLEHQRLVELSVSSSVAETNLLAQASVLMRRVALAVLPREQIASLTDAQWLEMLDRLGDTTQFSNGAGQLLTRHPYMPPGSVAAEEITTLLALLKTTIVNSDKVARRTSDRSQRGRVRV